MQGGWPMMDAGFCGDVQAVSASLPLNIIPALTKIYQLHLSYSSPSYLCNFLSLSYFLSCSSLYCSFIFPISFFQTFFLSFLVVCHLSLLLYLRSFLSFSLFIFCFSLLFVIPPFFISFLQFSFPFFILSYSVVCHLSLLHIFVDFFISLQISFSFPLTQHLHHVLCLFSLFCRFSFLYKMFNMSVSKVRHLSFH